MCVLLVEDEALIRLIFTEELTEAGFDVRDAADIDGAEALIRERLATFTLLVTDMNLPGRMDGIGIARLLRRLRPDLPIIFMSGRPDSLAHLGALGNRSAVLKRDGMVLNRLPIPESRKV